MEQNPYKLEGLKHWFDFFKHLTTLSTGTIVILATFLEKLFTYPRWNTLIGVSFGGFAVCLVFAVLSMAMYARAISESGNLGKREARAGIVFIAVCSTGFLVGAVSLVIFSLRNFY
jgi:amino acid transporter